MPVMINVEFKHVLGLPPKPSKNPNRYINVIFHIVKQQYTQIQPNTRIHICKQLKPKRETQIIQTKTFKKENLSI